MHRKPPSRVLVGTYLRLVFYDCYFLQNRFLEYETVGALGLADKKYQNQGVLC